MTLRLTPMRQAEFDSWRDGAMGDYVDELVAVGVADDDAVDQATARLAELLPDGLQTKGSFLSTAYVGADQVGAAWMSIRDGVDGVDAVLYDVFIEHHSRGDGLGRELLIALEEEAVTQGARSIAFEIFARHREAVALCERLGYRLASSVMRKPLSLSAERSPAQVDGQLGSGV